ncbi:hypothetical protein D9615_009083 [Tricholomella constricta]|uniref:Serine aminopeptidase S33 domain-containing protein n=1 Tax=Tricholomella constricta TaxID=117010 RepID=A0A8H5LY93_9AGAR|nr:hypothetical protein D9615_009083 [Tricholomella constricta]
MSDIEYVSDEPIGLKGLLGLLWRHGQNLLVYPAAFDVLERRRPPEIRTPAMLGIPYIAPLLRTSDGIDLSCYLLPQTRESLSADTYLAQGQGQAMEDCRVDVTPAAAEARATVIVFHGNSAHHWEDMVSAKDLFGMGCNVFLLSYRGYSLSGGSPNEKGRDEDAFFRWCSSRCFIELLNWNWAAGLRIDAQTGLDYILDEPHLSKTPIILYGHSLGGGVAIDLASRNASKVSAVIISNTFTSIPDIVRRWPYIGIFSFICHQKWRSADKMHLIPATTPILMLSGRKDEVIPPELMDKLWRVAQRRGRRRRGYRSGVPWGTTAPTDKAKDTRGQETRPGGDVFVTIEAGTHNDTPDFLEYWAAIQDFVEGVSGRTHRAPLSAPPPPPPPPPPPLLQPVTPKRVDRRWRYINRKLVVVQDSESGDL